MLTGVGLAPASACEALLSDIEAGHCASVRLRLVLLRERCDGISVSAAVALLRLAERPSSSAPTMDDVLRLWPGQNCTPGVRALVARGFLEDVPPGSDRRLHRVRVTEAGRELCQRLTALLDG